MKRVSALLACGLLTLAMTAGTAFAEGVSGEFTGEGIGMGGESNPVTVTITLEDGVITDLKAEGPGETPGIGTMALDELPGQIVDNGSVAVDNVTGASITSGAIRDAAMAALEAAGLDPADYSAEVEAVSEAPAEDETLDTDIVILGAGGAGMTAAITAADAGKNVILLESQVMVGGNTVRSSGGLNAADTPEQDDNEFTEGAGVERTLQTAADEWADNETITEWAATVKEQWDAYQENPVGYFDSAELMALDTIIGGHGINNPELLLNLTQQSAGAIRWLDDHGAPLPSVGAAGGASVNRIHRPVDEEGKTLAVGAYIVPILQQNLEDRENITLLTETTAEKILMDGDKAVGVEATGKTGNKITVNAKAVVIATGGFGANAEMVEKYRPELKGFSTTNADGILGQGIEMGIEVGASTTDIEQIQIHPTVHIDPDGNAHLITEGVRGDGAILVNKEGKRFFDEVLTRDKVSQAEIEQTDSEVYLILDQAMIDGSALYAGYVDAGYATVADTYEELAEALEIPADAFAETMAGWKEIWDNKEDPDFGRTSFSKEYDLTKAPYYAILVTPGIHHTMGGLTINTSAEVLKEDGSAIPGLFAAGEVTGGIHGGNRLGGTAVTDIIVYGEIAGNSAVSYVG